MLKMKKGGGVIMIKIEQLLSVGPRRYPQHLQTVGQMVTIGRPPWNMNE